MICGSMRVPAVTIKMPDFVEKDENHNVIKSMLIFIFSKIICMIFIYFFCLVMIGKQFLALYASADCNLNVKPSEYYDYLFHSSCER